MKNPWYAFHAKADDPTAVDIQIIDWIGDWIDDYIKEIYGDKSPITAKSFVAELSKLPEAVRTLNVHINSPGGDVQGAVNIANALRDQQASKGRTVNTIVEGIAASAASIIAMAGQRVVMADNALMMIHNPWTIAMGNAAEMRKTAEVLDTVRGQIIATYKWHSSLDEKAIAKLMDDETWMDADEALSNGFATEKVEGLKAAASIDPRAAAKLTVPDRYRARVDAMLAKPAPEPPAPVAATPAEILRLCRDGECMDQAEALLEASATVAQVTASVDSVRAARQQAAAREKEVRAICKVANLDKLADGYVKAGLPADAVRSHLTEITALLDKAEIDGGLDPNQKPAGQKAVIDIGAVYAERNKRS